MTRPVSEPTEGNASLTSPGALAEEQAALRRVATLVAGDPDAAQVFECVCEELGRLFEVETTNLLRFDNDESGTLMGCWATEGPAFFAVGDTVPVDGNTVSARIVRIGRPQRVDDYGALAGELAERLRSLGIASAVGAPIKVASRIWGAILASSRRPRAFPDGTEHRLALFAELVTAALANVDAREQLAASRARIVEAGDAERRRLERNLHDGAQQRLVSMALALREVDEKMQSDPGSASRLLASTREELALALGDLRELARGIHPAILSDRGLGPAIEALATHASEAVQVTAIPAGRLAEPVEVAAYYVVAEALANAIKHARDDRVTVQITRSADRLRIDVRDDGAGGAALGRGSGLVGLNDRVEAMGGSLRIESPPGVGTALIGEIPLW